MTSPLRQGVRGSRSTGGPARHTPPVRGLQGKLFCVICRSYRPKIRSQGGIHQQENVVPSGAQLETKKPMREKTSSGEDGRVGPYASVADARLRTSLKLHDLCVLLIGCKDDSSAQDVINAMFVVIEELDGYYGTKDVQTAAKPAP